MGPGSSVEASLLPAEPAPQLEIASAAQVEYEGANPPPEQILPTAAHVMQEQASSLRLEPSTIFAESKAPVGVYEERLPFPPAREKARAEDTGAIQLPSSQEHVPAQSEELLTPSFRTFGRDSSISADFLRAALIVLACLVAIGFILIALPQRTFDRMADDIRYRNSPPLQQEKIAFLFLGNEVKENQFHIRGAIRNISTQPIEQLDATIRLYAPDGTLLETAVVRMDSEQITPDAVATFHLTYPEYHGQFGSFSVDFKLRQGDPVLYKDMRGVRARE